MSDLREALAAALTLDMRSPLARIELAASRLQREALTPSARSLADGVSAAVSELDALIARTVSVLVPRPQAPSRPLRPALCAARARLAPSLAARGISWGEPGDGEASGDPELLRRAAAILASDAARGAEAGSRFRIDLEERPSHFGVRLTVEARGELEAAFEASRILVLGHGGEFRHGPVDGGWQAEIWLPREGPACAGS